MSSVDKCNPGHIFVFIELRGVIGGNGVDWWVMFSEPQVRDHGLWCQVREGNNAGMGSDIGD